jgi:hypothetical protein
MIRALPDDEWHANGSEAPLCSVPQSLAEVEARLGLTPAAAAALVLQLEGDVLRLQAQPSSGLVQVWVRGDVQTPGQCLPLLCKALGLREEQLPWVSNELGPGPGCWSGWTTTATACPCGTSASGNRPRRWRETLQGGSIGRPTG